MPLASRKIKPKVVPIPEKSEIKTKETLSVRLEHPSPAPISTASHVDEDGTTIISQSGDLVLAFEHEQNEHMHHAKFRVDRGAVARAASYFEVLLDPSRFEEGRRVATTLSTMENNGLDNSTHSDRHIPPVRSSTSTLPVIRIQDVGRISQVKSITLLLTDFLRLIHSQPLINAHPPLINLANLTIVFDRFSALHILKSYAHTHHLFTLLDTKLKSRNPLSEDKLRQRALIALHLDHPPWLAHSTQRLIQRHPAPEPLLTDPAWTDLPYNLEDELLIRRTALLETVQSIQSFFLAQYTSRTRQCRLGYDSSSACDSFQLGEAVKFFSRAGTLSLTGSLIPDDADPWEGDIMEVLEKWKMCPEYQIDGNHHHCGIRTRLLPVLERVERAVEEVGVCGDCWRDCREVYAWREAKGPLVWRKDEPARGMGMGDRKRCLARHSAVRDMCLARERIWG
ncbi:Hypothetical protein D9617_7g032100 [Elsinoe fawcettii]|nr:Hypothetical protein D9617_7g032100 [Elsinoe fawcettii]